MLSAMGATAIEEELTQGQYRKIISPLQEGNDNLNVLIGTLLVLLECTVLSLFLFFRVRRSWN
jgi:hypothetical protein